MALVKERTREALFACWKYGFIFSWQSLVRSFFTAPLLMRLFTGDVDVIRIGVTYLRIEGFILPIYMMLFAINSFLQALKRSDLDILDWHLPAILWRCLF